MNTTHICHQCGSEKIKYISHSSGHIFCGKKCGQKFDGFPGKELFGDIKEKTTENKSYRKVLWTTENMQLVLMTLPVGDFIEDEIHETTDQFFRVESGKIKAVINNNIIQGDDDFAFIIPKGTRHKILNNGDTPLQLYTIYSPPHHPPGRVDEKHPQ